MGHVARCGRVLAAFGALVLALSGPGSAWPWLDRPVASAQDPDNATPTAATSGYRGTTAVDGYRGDFADLAVGIDDFWSETFARAGAPYRSPGIVAVDRPLATACGPIEPVPNAMYCPLDLTIYLVPGFLADQERAFGDYAPIVILAHEWGHHVQRLLGIDRGLAKTHELQADCLAGAFTARADEVGLLDAGDVLEAIAASVDAGDRVGLPSDNPGAHGSAEERVKALMKGFGGGPAAGCGLPLSADGPPPPPLPPPLPPTRTPTPTPVVVDLSDLLPAAPALPHGACFFVVDDGAWDFAAVLERFPGAPDAPERLSDLGWQDGAFRQFGCNGPPAGSAGWIDVSIHRFGDAPSAQAAVPYFAATRIADSSLRYAGAAPIGEATTAVAGPASNGWEYTLYASRGPYLVRVTGVAPAGDPAADVAAVMADVLAGTPAAPGGGAPPTPVPAAQPAPDQPGFDALAALPDALPLADGRCFVPIAQWAFSEREVASFLGRAGAPATLVDAWGWQGGANRTFRCLVPPPGGAEQIDVSLHRFADAAAARAAEPFLRRGYATGSDEARQCGTAGVDVVCVTGRGAGEPPAADVAAVLRDAAARVR